MAGPRQEADTLLPSSAAAAPPPLPPAAAEDDANPLELAAAAEPPPPAAAASDAPKLCLRLEYIGERQTRGILVAQWLASLVSWAALCLLVLAQFNADTNYLMRSSKLEVLNISVACVCLAGLLGAATFFFCRIEAARRAGTVWGARRSYLLGMTGVDLLLQLANLAVFLAANILSYQTPCSWFSIPVDALFFVSSTLWNTLFLLSISRPLVLLPHGSWRRLHERLSVRVGSCWHARRRGSASGLASPGAAASKLPADEAADLAEAQQGEQQWQEQQQQQQQQQEPPQQQQEPAAAQRSRVLARMATGLERMRHVEVGPCVWAHLAFWLLLWVPMEIVSVVMVLGTMGVVNDNDVYVCTDSQCTASVPYTKELMQQEPWASYSSCTQLTWDCAVSSYWVRMSVAVAAMNVAHLVIFMLLMGLVLYEYQRLPYAPNRAMNVVARLQLRTRGFASLFFLISLTLIYFLNMSSCNANVELWLGLTPVHISMSVLVAVEAILYSPAAPEGASLRHFEHLQQFAWTEAEAPAVQARRGLPDEPLFCFETAVKACYACMCTYRHFSPTNTVTSLDTLLKLFSCTHHEWLREPTRDMNCLLCWGPDTLVVIFRGTQSLKNVWEDAKYWRSAHPPARGRFVLGTMPLVHAGFLKSWSSAGLDAAVLGRIREVLEGVAHRSMAPHASTVVRCCSEEHEEVAAALAAASAAAHAAEGPAAAENSVRASSDTSSSSSGDGGSSGSDGAAASSRPFRLLVTGHSLGGCVGQLCATDLARLLPEWGFSVQMGPSSGGAAGPAAAPDAAAASNGAAPAAGAAASNGAAPAAAAAAASNGAGAADNAASSNGAGAADAAATSDGAGSTGAAAAARRATAVALQVYTYGSPRTGNHAFAREYGAAVRDSWAVINDQDLVPKQGKLWVLFKRAGHTCIVSPAGDMVVNPHFLERSVHRSAVRSSVSQHLLTSYSLSFAAILRGMHTGKSVGHGTQALAALDAANPALREVLLRPLAFSAPSLRRYIGSGAPAAAPASAPAAPAAAAAAPAAAAPAAAAAVTSQLSVRVAPLGAEGDLSGIDGEAPQAPATMQALQRMLSGCGMDAGGEAEAATACGTLPALSEMEEGVEEAAEAEEGGGGGPSTLQRMATVAGDVLVQVLPVAGSVLK